MALTVLSHPGTGGTLDVLGNTIEPKGVNECALYCIGSNEQYSGSCTQANIDITITSPSVQTTGQTFEICGHVFTVDNSGAAYTGWTVPWQGANALTTAIGINNMLQINPFFGGIVDIYLSGDATEAGILIVWKECGVVTNFGTEFGGLSVAPVVVEDQGTDYVEKEGYEMYYEVWRVNPLTLLEEKLCGQTCKAPYFTQPYYEWKSKICFDIANEIACRMGTNLPTDLPGPFINTLHRQQYFVRYGSRWDGDPCGIEYGSYYKSLKFWALFSGFDNDDVNNMNDYFFPSLANVAYNDIKFMTRRPQGLPMCEITGEHFNLYLNFFQLGAASVILRLKTAYYDGNGTEVSFPSVAWTETIRLDGVYQIGVSSAVLGIGLPPGAETYGIRIEANINGAGFIQIVEDYVFKSMAKCNCDELVYFLDDFGNWSVLPMKRSLVTQTVTADDVCIDEPCKVGANNGNPVNNSMYKPVFQGGKGLVNNRNDVIYSYQYTYKRTSEFIQWIKIFQRSGNYLLLDVNTAFWKKLTPIPGTMQILQDGDNNIVTFEATEAISPFIRQYNV